MESKQETAYLFTCKRCGGHKPNLRLLREGIAMCKDCEWAIGEPIGEKVESQKAKVEKLIDRLWVEAVHGGTAKEVESLKKQILDIV